MRLTPVMLHSSVGNVGFTKISTSSASTRHTFRYLHELTYFICCFTTDAMKLSYAGVVSWFPGHMLKASRELASIIPRCNLVVEMRDARLPYTSANAELARACIASGTRSVVVYNKYDLCDPVQLHVRTCPLWPPNAAESVQH